MRRLLMVLTFLLLPSLVFGLAVEYMRNGECYLLIGHNDVAFRGVYRLNNPSSEPDGNPVGVKLFDPRDSYGIAVNLDRKVYTFSENTSPTYVMENLPLKRLLKKPGGVGLWGAHCDTRKSYYVSTENITYNQSNRDIYTTTGPMGSNNSNLSNDPTNVSWTWSGIVKPTIKKPSKWYFQKTAVYCDSSCTYTNGTGDAYWLHFVPVDGSGYGSIPNNSWWQSRDPDPSGRKGNMFYWDRAYRKYTYYDLNYWNKALGIWSSSSPVYGKYAGVADKIFDEIVKRSRISACLNVVCVNGSNEQNFSAKPKFTCLAMSPFGRMYLYTRTQNSAADGELRLNGTTLPPTSSNIRGYLNDLSTQWVGISAKSKSDDFIYLLGTKIIKDWLAQFNIKPASLNITSVAVSDQWWLDGGIVYAYDEDEGAAYQFIRFDKAGNNTCKTIPKKIVIGKGVDALKADGFGNLFYAKTTKEPSATSAISWPNLYTYYGYSFYSGRAYAIAYYRQKVYKTVFGREIGATSDYQVGKIHIGNNIYRRFFSVPMAQWSLMSMGNISTIASQPGWAWMGGLQVNSLISDPKLTQLGVINVATPPNTTRPNGQLGVVDIVGVEDVSSGFNFLTDEVDQAMHTFRIENAPYWEGRNNIATPGKTKWEGDRNGNGTEGGFVSSLMNTSSFVDSSPQVLYSWKIYKIQDAFGNPLPSPQLVKELTNTSSTAIKYYFRAGTYQIMSSAKFKWYDFDSMPFGSTVDDLPSSIRPTSGYQSATAAPVNPGINSAKFPGLKKPFPANTAVTILRVNRQIPIPTGKKVEVQKLAKSLWEDPKVFGATHYHCVWEDEDNKWRLKEDPKDKAGDYLHDLYNLPVINNSNAVPNTLVWENNMPVQYEWTFNLTLPDGTVYPAQEISKQSWGQNDVAITLKQDFPTDPATGKLVCKAYRDWKYLENTYDNDGNYIGQKPITGTIEYAGDVDILVKDQTPPKVIAINGKSLVTGSPLSPIYLGTTSGLVTTAISHNGYSNPASFSILVEDNNIYANMDMVAPVAAADRLHNRASKQVATFYFERGSGKSLFPNTPGNVDFKHYTSPGVANAADIKNNAWLTKPAYKLMRQKIPYKQGDTSSFLLYVFKVADWDHLQPGTVGDFRSDPSRWPIDFANNSPTYKSDGALGASHPGYALFLAPTDSSGNVSPRGHLGNAWVRDDLLPMVFSETSDFIASFKELQPFGIEKYLVKHPFDLSMDYPWYGKLPNNFPDWAVKNTGTYPVLNDLLGIPCGLAAKMNTAYHPPIIQEGMEVFMQVKAMDNIAISTNVLPMIQVTGPKGLYAEGAPPQINESSGNRENIRLLLQKSGVYDVALTAEDNALDFFDKPTPNKRTVRFGVVVGPAAMEIRVIDKKNSDF